MDIWHQAYQTIIGQTGFPMSNTILFTRNDDLFNLLQKVTTVNANGKVSTILNVDSDDQWIRVTIDGDANFYAYPMVMTFE